MALNSKIAQLLYNKVIPDAYFWSTSVSLSSNLTKDFMSIHTGLHPFAGINSTLTSAVLSFAAALSKIACSDASSTIFPSNCAGMGRSVRSTSVFSCERIATIEILAILKVCHFNIPEKLRCLSKQCSPKLETMFFSRVEYFPNIEDVMNTSLP